ncbi:acyl-CoA dehydrogenase family protein [Mycobacterium sp.]|uniref:acyl-CoA dehydrogenase family protein n=1 Tax=Mycobacterium sp. TaxID=1785 RepID=UPI0025F9BA4E|nr:acyl-CoA dehydrogenase family protein [Mycobacterium sp.]
MSAELLEDLRTTTRRALSAGSGDVVDELGLVGLLVDSDLGGLGMGDQEMALVGTELGRALSPSSFLPTAVLATTLLIHAETKAAAESLAGVMAGDTRCGVALADSNASWAGSQRSRAPVTAVASDGGWLLNGTVWGLSTPAQPDSMLTVASIDGNAVLFAVAGEHLYVTPADQLDASRGLVELTLSDVPARLLADNASAARAFGEAYRRGLLAVGAEQVGVARASLDLAVEYAKTRSQFGSPVGSFQAIKHRCAEVLLDVELADAVVDQAVHSGTSVDAELAFTVATRAALAATEACIQIHGGIGFTWEHQAHRYLRRARVNATLLGPSAVHRGAIAASAGLNTAEGGQR